MAPRVRPTFSSKVGRDADIQLPIERIVYNLHGIVIQILSVENQVLLSAELEGFPQYIASVIVGTGIVALSST